MNVRRWLLALLLGSGVVLGYGSALAHAVHGGTWHARPACAKHVPAPP